MQENEEFVEHKYIKDVNTNVIKRVWVIKRTTKKVIELTKE